MRLLRLDLEAFGTLSGRSVAFDPRPGVLSVVYGPNEAGKSTSLRAIHALLYGIPSSSPDGHSTPGGEIRVAGAITNVDGATLVLRRRRKGRTVSLVDGDDRAIDEATLFSTYALPDAETFRSLHGLDHVSLREGAALVLDARGRVGELLFDAARMGPSVGRVLRDLDEEAEALFAPLARKRPLNEAIRSFADLERRTRLEALDVDAYERQLQAITQASADALALEAERKRLAAELEARRELRTRVPLAKEKRRIMLGRAALARGASLPLAAFEERRRAVQDIQEGTSMLSLLEAERLRIAEATDALPPDDPIVDRADEVEELRAASAVLVAFDDGGKLDARLAEIGAALGTARPPDVPTAKLARLLGTAGSAIADALRAVRAQAELAQLDQRLAHARRELADTLVLADDEVVPDADRFAEMRRAVVASAIDVRAARARRDARVDAGAREVASAPWHDAMRDVTRSRRDLGDAVETLAAVTRETAYADAAAAVSSRLAVLEAGLDRLLAAGSSDRSATDRARDEEEVAAALDAFVKTAAAAGLGDATVDDVEARVDRAGRLVDRAAALVIDRAARLAAVEAATAAARTSEEAVRREATEVGVDVDGDLDAVRARLEAAIGGRALADERAGLEERARARGAATSRVTAILDALGVDGDGAPAVRAVAAVGRFVKARKDREARAAAGARRALCLDRIGRETERVSAARARLQAMAAAAEVRIEDLDLAEAKARAIEALESDEREVDEKLAMIAGKPLDAAEVEALERVDLEVVEAEIEDAQQRLADVAQRRDAALRDVGGKEAGLRDFEEKETGAAEAAILAEAELSRMRELSRRYATLRLARAMLADEVERYRKEHEGPVLGRARELFARLTLGRFEALVVDALSGPVPEIRCRSGEELLEVSALSEGTRDQLYLALRIATLEHLASTREPLPLVLDDVLVHFDEARAEVALRILAEAARRFQVVLFTHQRRIVELCEAVIPAECREVHVL